MRPPAPAARRSRTWAASRSPRSSASAADASRTSASGIVPAPLHPHRLYGGGPIRVRMPLPLRPPDGFEPVERSQRTAPALPGVTVEQTAVLHGHEHGDGAMVPLDEEPLARRRGIQDGAERSAEVQRCDVLHGHPSYPRLILRIHGMVRSDA